MSVPNFVTKNSWVAASANSKESALNTAQTLDTSFLFNIGSVPNLEPLRESNADEMTGKEEADVMYDLGMRAGFNLETEKMQAQHMAFLAAYALGDVSTANVGVAGKKHTITPTADQFPPTFTLAARYGGNIAKRRLVSCCVDSLNLSFDNNAFIKLTAQIKGTGKYDKDLPATETVSAAGSAPSLTVASAVLDDLAENVHQILAETSAGVWEPVAVTSVSTTTINITSPAVAGTIDYKVVYRTAAAWSTAPNRVDEDIMLLGNATVIVGGAWDGSALDGGVHVKAESKAFEWALDNNIEVYECPEAGGSFAGGIIRGQRAQTITLRRQMRSYVWQQLLEENGTTSIYVKFVGKSAYETGRYYTVELVFPKVGIKTGPVADDNRLLGETLTLDVLQDDTYGSVVCIVENMQASYAA